MRVQKKNVYYCDYCKKRSLSAPHMSSHEKSCTNNPDRHCKLCTQQSIKTLIEQFKQRFELKPHVYEIGEYECPEYDVVWKGQPVTLQEIRDEVGNCPNCILAILRQAGFNRHYFKFESFDYKKELQQELNERKANYDNDVCVY